MSTTLSNEQTPSISSQYPPAILKHLEKQHNIAEPQLTDVTVGRCDICAFLMSRMNLFIRLEKGYELRHPKPNV